MKDGDLVTVPDSKEVLREGTLEVLSAQVFVQFPEGDGVFMPTGEFKRSQK